MTKTMKIGILIAIVFGIGLSIILTNQLSGANNRKPELSTTPSTQESNQVQVTAENPQPDANATNSYQEFSDTVLLENLDKRRILFFYANWCPTCKAAEQDIQANMHQLPTDVVVIRVNYNDTDTDDSEKELARNYAITYQHTFVYIDAQNNAIKTWNGGQIKEIIANIN